MISTKFLNHTEPASAALALRQIHFIHKRANDQYPTPAWFQQICFVGGIGYLVQREALSLVFNNDFDGIAAG